MGWGFESPWAYHRPGQPRTRSGTLARILLATPAFPSHTRLYTTGGTSHTVNDLPLKNSESRRKHLLERRDNRSMNSPNPLKNEKSSSVLGGAVTGTLLITIALHNAVPPLATDMYSPAFPEITTDLSTSASAVGFTLTAFFIGFGAGQIGGGALSDQRGRRGPLIIGGLLSILGSLACAFSPSILFLFFGRVLQGLGGGAAAAVARAILVDLAHGHVLARAMSLLQAIGGLAPMIAPVLGGVIVTYMPWRWVFWFLTAFTILMTLAAWAWAPESLPEERRHGGGLFRFLVDMGSVLKIRAFLGFMLTSAFSGFCMFAYIADSSYILQQMLGMSPLRFSIVFASNALLSTVLALVNVRLIGRFEPRPLITFGLALSLLGVVILSLSVFVFNVPTIPVLIGFALIMAATAFIFGNAGARALAESREHAGTASAVQGLVQATAMATASPLATSGGGTSAVPMILVMILGTLGAWVSFFLIARPKAT